MKKNNEILSSAPVPYPFPDPIKALQILPDNPEYFEQCKKMSADQVIRKLEEYRHLYWSAFLQRQSIVSKT